MSTSFPAGRPAAPRLLGWRPADEACPWQALHPHPPPANPRPTAPVNHDDSDESLMLAWAQGNAAAFDRLYQRFRKPLFGFLLRGIGDRALAEECFQDVWMRVIDARHRYRPEARFSTWLFQIAHHRMVDLWRRQRPQTSLEEREEAGLALVSTQPAPAEATAACQQRRRLQQALAALPDEQRTALLLRLGQGMSWDEIGEVTGAGRETVKSRLRYAMDKLRRLLGEEEE
ncbi:MAG: RNA polymerase sigma factor [Lysobacteraceae bacterium]|nr:MAG: RNA polymerase sigma factor [Xanthomonadaceae bacterium]